MMFFHLIPKYLSVLTFMPSSLLRGSFCLKNIIRGTFTVVRIRVYCNLDWNSAQVLIALLSSPGVPPFVNEVELRALQAANVHFLERMMCFWVYTQPLMSHAFRSISARLGIQCSSQQPPPPSIHFQDYLFIFCHLKSAFAILKHRLNLVTRSPADVVQMCSCGQEYTA